MQKRANRKSTLDGIVFHLLHRASQRADQLFEKEAGNGGLTPRQFAVLLAVREAADPSQTDLVAATGIDRSTIADLVRRLVNKGLLQRQRSRSDARAYVVRLSGSGRGALKSMQSKAARVDSALLTGLGNEQRLALIETLKTISNRDEAFSG
jgi:DNA-binding MarR family transcriptional regulator